MNLSDIDHWYLAVVTDPARCLYLAENSVPVYPTRTDLRRGASPSGRWIVGDDDIQAFVPWHVLHDVVIYDYEYLHQRE